MSNLPIPSLLSAFVKISFVGAAVRLGTVLISIAKLSMVKVCNLFQLHLLPWSVKVAENFFLVCTSTSLVLEFPFHTKFYFFAFECFPILWLAYVILPLTGFLMCTLDFGSLRPFAHILCNSVAICGSQFCGKDMTVLFEWGDRLIHYTYLP